MTVEELRDEVCRANRDLEARGLLLLGQGCASAIDRARGVVVAKPAAIPHAALTPADMLVLDLSGNGSDGTPAPAPELTAHLCLYGEFDSIGGIASTTSPFAVAFAQAEKPIPCLGMIHARWFKGEIPVTRQLRKPEMDRSYERSLGSVIIERFARFDVTAMQGVLVARHGPFAWGRTVADAVRRVEALEEAARLAYRTLQLTPAIQPLAAMLADKQYAGG